MAATIDPELDDLPLRLATVTTTTRLSRRRRRGERRGLWSATFVVALVMTSVATYLVATRVQPSARPEGASSPYFLARARTRVVSSHLALDGTVQQRQTVAVLAGGADAGGGVITDVRAARGDRLDEGAVPIVIGGRPVVVLQGSVPAYRDLGPGDSGVDVGQLQDALRRLGLSVTDPVGPAGPVYGPSTASAVAALYARLGFSPAMTSNDAANQLRQASRAVDDAAAQVRKAQRNLDQADESQALDLQDARDDASRALTVARESYADLLARTGARMPRAEVAYVGELPVTVSAVAPAGSVVPAGSPAIELASGPLVVRAEVQQNLATALRPGMRGEITVGAEPPIAVTVATVRSTTDAGDSGTPTSDVVLIPDEPLSQPVDAPVHAIVTLAATDGETLAVPVAAVTQTPDGRTFVSVLRHGTSNRVEVRVGPSGDGWVSITPLGGGLSARTRVVLGRRSA